MLHFCMKKLIEDITKYVPTCEQEQVDRKLFLDIAKTFPNSLTRENPVTHFTASALLLNKEKTELVSIYHNLYDSWAWMGGHADGDEDLLHVARKEVEEECGIKDITLVGRGIFTLECLSVQGHIKKGKYVTTHLHLNVTYVFTTTEKLIRIKPDENSNIAWFTFDEFLQKSTEPHMLPTYNKIINKIKNL